MELWLGMKSIGTRDNNVKTCEGATEFTDNLAVEVNRVGDVRRHKHVQFESLQRHFRYRIIIRLATIITFLAIFVSYQQKFREYL